MSGVGNWQSSCYDAGVRILLTGGLGFIGHHTVEHLLENTDWEIVVVDALRHVGRSDRLADIQGYDPDRVEVIWHDLRSPLNSRRTGNIDYIINMASDSHVDRSLEDPVPFVSNNVSLAMTMLEFAREMYPLKFIQVGTDEVFGPAPLGVAHDEDASLRPSNPYSASKAAQEVIAQAWWRAYDVPVILTRTMNNFGERQDVEKYVPKVIKKVLNNEVIEVHSARTGRGSWQPGSRIWLHARNHADALLHILRTVDVKTPRDHDFPEAFNIAGDVEWDNLEIVHLVERYTRRSAKVEMVDFHSSRPGHDMRYALDGSKLAATGWKMPIASETSFRRTVGWYLENTNWL